MLLPPKLASMLGVRSWFLMTYGIGNVQYSAGVTPPHKRFSLSPVRWARAEAAVDKCLTPVLSAPVKQLRELAKKLRDTLKSDPRVPYLVWRGMEEWIDKILLLAPDGEIIELKTQLASEIVAMVEDDAKRDLPAAMVRALQWRSAEKLQEVKVVIEEEKAAGRPVRLKGRESCLFLEAGGTEDSPKVCVQV